jgi:hypothetical protein
MEDTHEEQIDQEVEDGTDNERDEWATETWPSRNHTDESLIDWLEPLTTDAPPLILNFYSSSKGQKVNLTKNKFEGRLSWCLSKLKLPPLPIELVDELFDMALKDCQQMTAYRLFEKALTGTEFKETADFVKRERERVELILTALDMPWNSIAPRKIYEWKNVWLGSLRELVGTIHAQLRSAEKDMSGQRAWLKSGRTNLESHLLWLALPSIQTMLKSKGLRIGSMALLVAYGHASQLAKYGNASNDGEPVEAMKMRMARAKKSKKKAEVLGLFILQYCSRGQP